jgi:methylthioribose-1-phosphate isomerase
LVELQGQAIAPADMEAINPVFDVTPAALIDVIVCEKGVIRPVDEANLRKVVAGP